MAGRGNVIPVAREVPADCLTPVLSFLSTASRSRRSFLLESVEGGERIARYSFVGRDPYRVVEARGDADFLDRLREIFRPLHPVRVPDLPRFTGGAVGFVSYDAVRLFEPVGCPGENSGRLPDAWFGLYDTVLAFDHLRMCVLLIASVLTEEDGRPLRRQYAAAQERLDRLASDLARSPRRGRAPLAPARKARAPRSNITPRAYTAMVEKAKEHIRAGDIFQAVLSQRFEMRLTCDPFAVYRALRRINPSPYMYFLRDGNFCLAGASPEMLVRAEGRQVELHPIAGTRPRGKDPDEDARLEADLRADGKERAEHVMLVDLGRNDLGRVCEAGSVGVPELMTVQRFSHVMHLVSRVTGRLATGRDSFDALRAAFPAGTVTGAPKVRAMQIIAELEPDLRGPYAGAVCYIDHSGNLDSCIIIRTMVAEGDRAWVQAGGGIVADSDPRREFEETVSKASAVLSAIEGAKAWVR